MGTVHLFLQYTESYDRKYKTVLLNIVQSGFNRLLFISEDGELWEYFPCPFCYIEVEVPFICNHLQEEHCFDTRNAVSTTLQSYSDQSGSDLTVQLEISLLGHSLSL